MNRFSVAPMIDWTDRHCRYFHRLVSHQATLYTEMVVDQAILHGDAARLLDADADKDKVVVQLGGSDPALLGEATKIAYETGYQEINLNCGCPSDRVQAGTFGAVLMYEPERVLRLLEAMSAASPAKVSVKIRLGVDEQIVEESLPRFLEVITASGVSEVTIHARKAWLQGLSPKDNRTIPPLDYDLAYAMKQAFPDVKFALNGGLGDLAQAQEALTRFDGVMLGRAAYQRPYEILGHLDREIYGEEYQLSREAVIEAMTQYLHEHVAKGGRVHSVTRHMLGLFHGQKGGRLWRQILSQEAKDNDPDLLLNALARVRAA